MYLFIAAMHVMTVVRDKGSLAPLADKNLWDSSGVDAAAVAAKKSVDSGPSRTPSSLAYVSRIKTHGKVGAQTWEKRERPLHVDAYNPPRHLTSSSRDSLVKASGGGVCERDLSPGTAK